MEGVAEVSQRRGGWGLLKGEGLKLFCLSLQQGTPPISKDVSPSYTSPSRFPLRWEWIGICRWGRKSPLSLQCCKRLFPESVHSRETDSCWMKTVLIFSLFILNRQKQTKVKAWETLKDPMWDGVGSREDKGPQVFRGNSEKNKIFYHMCFFLRRMGL